MAAKKSETLDFTRRYLREKPEATFAEIRDAAAKENMKIYPIVFGRAKALEGLVKVAPYGSKKRAREEKAAAQRAASMQVGGDVAEGGVSDAKIDSVISGVRESHQERERYRAALIKISKILDELL
jgi:hypothetical protein